MKEPTPSHKTQPTVYAQLFWKEKMEMKPIFLLRNTS